MTAQKERAQSPCEAAPESKNTQAHYNPAANIERHHLLARQHADTAVHHARAAGLLLLKLKTSLPHGEWLPWLHANVTVSPRQAQRYMRAAEGKPLPARKIASPPKNDTVAFLKIKKLSDIPMPKFRAGEYLRAVVVHDRWYDELLVIPDETGLRAYVGHWNGPAIGGQPTFERASLQYTIKPRAIADLACKAIVFSFPWNRAEIVERCKHPGFDRNPFELTGGAQP